MSATVIIPTTGAPEVRNAIESVLKQTYPTTCYLVCDGSEHQEKVTAIAFDYVKYKNFKISYLPINVGAKGFYGHRVYAAFTHLVDT
jgi:GT2 family glycosyltransferase